MALEPITAILDIGSKLIDRLWPDPIERDKAKLELMRMQQQGELAEMVGQLEINKEEAKNPSLLVSGWRPAAGWVCVASLAAVYIPKAIVLTSIWTYQAVVIVSAWQGVGAVPVLPMYPDLGVTDLIGLLGALLGIGAMRSREKLFGVASK
jgi:hypothetical protein